MSNARTRREVKKIQFKSDAPGRHSGTFDDKLIPDGTYTLLDVQGFDSKNENRIFNNILQGADNSIHVLMRVEEVQKTMPWINHKGVEGTYTPGEKIVKKGLVYRMA